MRRDYKTHSSKGEYLYPLLVAFKSTSFTKEEKDALTRRAARNGDCCSTISYATEVKGGSSVLIVYDYYIVAHSTLFEKFRHTMRIARAALLRYLNLSTVEVVVWFDR